VLQKICLTQAVQAAMHPQHVLGAVRLVGVLGVVILALGLLLSPVVLNIVSNKIKDEVWG
jgi:hypothetical protein